MPRYELSLIMKCLERPLLISAIKRAAEDISTKGGIIRSFENLGERELPYRFSRDGSKYSNGHYFLVDFDSPVSALPGIRDTLRRDIDVLRPKVLRKEVEVRRPCETKPCNFGELTEEKYKELKYDLATCIKKL